MQTFDAPKFGVLKPSSLDEWFGEQMIHSSELNEYQVHKTQRSSMSRSKFAHGISFH